MQSCSLQKLQSWESRTTDGLSFPYTFYISKKILIRQMTQACLTGYRDAVRYQIGFFLCLAPVPIQLGLSRFTPKISVGTHPSNDTPLVTGLQLSRGCFNISSGLEYFMISLVLEKSTQGNKQRTCSSFSLNNALPRTLDEIWKRGEEGGWRGGGVNCQC